MAIKRKHDNLNDESSKKQKTKLSFGYNLALLGKATFLLLDYMLHERHPELAP